MVSDMLDKTIRDPEQVARTLRTEVIGSLPLMKTRPGTGFSAAAARRQARPAPNRLEHDLSGFNESVRTLRNSILLGSFDRRYRSLLVTSAAPGEGKTTTAANLAAAHAEQGKRTLLIDGDLRRPSVHRNFNLPSVVGLSNVSAWARSPGARRAVQRRRTSTAWISCPPGRPRGARPTWWAGA